MKKNLVTLLFAVVFCIGAFAQPPESVFNNVVSRVTGSGSVSANFTISSKEGSMKGTMLSCGPRFRVFSSDMKCWYDGKTMWTWSKATGEVNITTPTTEELEMTNPIATAEGFRRNFTMTKESSKGNTYTIRFTPKKKSNIKSVVVNVALKTYQITNVKFISKKGAVTNIAV